MTESRSHRHIGVFGGTFDPVHLGHVNVVQEVHARFQFDRTLLIPANIPPHREQAIASPWQRLEMLRLAVAEHSHLLVDDIELHRDEPSYSVNTLRLLKEREGDVVLYLILGIDAFQYLDQWYQWQELFDLAHIIVLSRPGIVAKMSDQLRQEYNKRAAYDRIALSRHTAGRIIECKVSDFAISSSDIRSKLQEKKSVRHLIPEAVMDYICLNHLYDQN